MLEYLRDATPRFHICGRHVSLEYSTPQGVPRKPRGTSTYPTSAASSSSICAAVQVAAAAIQAAQWSQTPNKTVR